MPCVCRLGSVLIYIYHADTDRHQSPHLHARYGGGDAVVIEIGTEKVLEGKIHPRRQREVIMWAARRRGELAAAWRLAQANQPLAPSPSRHLP